MRQFVRIFLITLFTSLNYGALIYVQSTYLGQYFVPAGVTTLFLLGYLFNIFIFAFAPFVLEKTGRQRLLAISILVTFLSSMALAYGSGAYLTASMFVIYQGFIFLAYWSLDLCLESRSADAFTGEIRGIYYTFINVGIALGPLGVSLLSKSENLNLIYRVAGVIMLIPLMLAWKGFFARKTVADLGREPFSLPLKKFWHMRDLRAITISRFILEIFYGVMVVYTPIYLHSILGFGWAQLGVIFTIALLPFIFLELPAGELADRYFGEKEMLSIGFFIAGTTLLIMPFIDGSFSAWLLALLVSRIGASLIEIMTETYFFKKIDVQNTGLLSIFRLSRPFGLLTGALLGFVISQFLSYPAIFLSLGVIVLLGLYESLHLKDTR